MRRHTRRSGLIVLLLLFLSLPVYGQEEPGSRPTITAGETGVETERLYTVLTGRSPFTGNMLLYLPSGDLYPPYAADPIRPCFSIQPVSVLKGSIPNASDSRINLRAGGQVGLVRSRSRSAQAFDWQLSLLGGFNDQNDLRESLDNIGWDGHYGLVLTAARKQSPAFKLAWLHVSSHVGDEYIERTGRKRISYTREEIAAGISLTLNEQWRVYTEAGRAISMSNKQLQEPWRGQAGIEYESGSVLWQNRMSWYAAVDAQSFEERDWRFDLSFQSGFLVRSGGRIWRFGAEWYNGRPPIGEFFQFTERYAGIGVWIDI